MRSFRISVQTCVFVLGFALLTVNLAAQQWQARHGLTAAEYQTTFNDLVKQGYRLKCMSGYVSGGVERYAALWIKEGGPEWQARAGLSEADYQKTFNDLKKEGYRLTWISAHEVKGAVHYEGIWEKKAGGAWEALGNLSSAEYQQTFDNYTKQGYRMLQVSGYSSGGSQRFAAIFEKSAGPAWTAHHNMTASQYQQTFDDMSKQGYRLKDLSGYNVGGTDYYAAIWEKTNAHGGGHGMAFLMRGTRTSTTIFTIRDITRC